MKKIKVLYVEDEIFLAKIVGETLQSRGFDVIMESDGGNAVALFQQSKPDVCVLDIMLPNKDGFTIADEIRELDTNVPIIFLSAKSGVNDVVTGFKAGANDYIRKPFSIEELIVRIENVLKQTHSENLLQTDEFKIGQYNFNTQRQVLAHATEERKLSYREKAPSYYTESCDHDNADHIIRSNSLTFTCKPRAKSNAHNHIDTHIQQHTVRLYSIQPFK